jgi:SseB protein C-terminal domain
MQHLEAGTGVRFLIGHPPTEPATLLTRARAALSAVPAVARAGRAWISVPGRGEGLVIVITLDDPASEQAREAAASAIEQALAAVPLYVPFPVDVSFPGEPLPEPQYSPRHAAEPPVPPDPIVDWTERNTRSFYTRD